MQHPPSPRGASACWPWGARGTGARCACKAWTWRRKGGGGDEEEEEGRAVVVATPWLIVEGEWWGLHDAEEEAHESVDERPGEGEAMRAVCHASVIVTQCVRELVRESEMELLAATAALPTARRLGEEARAVGSPRSGTAPGSYLYIGPQIPSGRGLDPPFWTHLRGNSALDILSRSSFSPSFAIPNKLFRWRCAACMASRYRRWMVPARSAQREFGNHSFSAC